jgi:hypothetical protein
MNSRQHLLLVLLWMICLLTSASTAKADNPEKAVKHRASYYTDVKLRHAAENIRSYSWARAQKDDAVRRAERWLKDYHQDLASFWKMIPCQQIPRSYAVNSWQGCLACGRGINKFGNYGYQWNPAKVDWKLTCPCCHLTFPTNDFASYYQGGLDGHGQFDPERAHRHNDDIIRSGGKGYLVNLYTIKGLTSSQIQSLSAAGVPDSVIRRITTDPSWGVDDGYGYHFNANDKERYGNPYTYVAYYAHWALWYKRFMPMLQDFSEASVLTRYSDNPKERERSQTYADAAIVMLDRIADLYPTLHVSEFPRKGYFGFPNNGFRWGTQISAGRIVGSIWENELIKDIMFAYDAVFPQIATLSKTARQLLVRCSGKVGKGLPDNIEKNFEQGVLRQVPIAFADGDLQGNPGMQQSSLALAAVVLDHGPETCQWLNTVFRNGHSDWSGSAKRDGGSVLRYIVNRINRDGQGDEISIAYNAGWIFNWLIVARILDGYTIPNGEKLTGNVDPNLFHNARFRKRMEANYPFLLTEHYVPHIGDTSLTGCPGFEGNPDYKIINPADVMLSYLHYHTDELAQAVYLLYGRDLKNIHADIFTGGQEKIRRQIADVISRKGELHLPSANLTAYGLALLRDGRALKGKPSTERTMWMFYGNRSASHNHADPLNLGYIAYDLDLMPDFGYPNTLGGDLNPEQQWDKSTPAHNTVSFDDLGYRGHIVGYGKPLHFDDNGMVKVIHVTDDGVQNSNIRFAKQYERATAMIRIDSTDSYLVDFFHVNSSRHYTYNFHTAEIEDKATVYKGLTFSSESPMTFDSHTLRNVHKVTSCDKQFSIDWKILDTWNCYGHGVRANTDVHLKFTAVGHYPSFRVGEAVPPTNNGANPKWLPELMLPGVGNTTFTSVIEPYRSKSRILSIERVPVTVGPSLADSITTIALRVKLSNGRTDYIVCSMDSCQKYRVADKFDFRGFIGVYSEDSEGKVGLRYVNDGDLIAGVTTRSHVSGKIVDATSDLTTKNEIWVKMDQPIDASLLKGRYIYIDNDDQPSSTDLLKYNAIYLIKDVYLQENRTYRLILGDSSVIRGWKMQMIIVKDMCATSR